MCRQHVWRQHKLIRLVGQQGWMVTWLDGHIVTFPGPCPCSSGHIFLMNVCVCVWTHTEDTLEAEK